MLAYTAGYAFSATHTDTADELLRAYEIRHAISYPLQGPPLGQVLHLGPIWYYIVAVPLFIHDSWLSAALFVGALCSLKFPLAYHCGSRVLDRRFGLLWCAALLLPGWSTLEQLVFLNPNAVASVELGVLAMGISLCSKATYGRFAAAGLLLALAAHVHPTAAPAATFLIPGLLQARRYGKSLFVAIAMVVLPFFVLVSPYLAVQASAGFPDWGASRDYAAGEVTLRGAFNAPTIAWNYMSGGVQELLHAIAGVDDERARRLSAVSALLVMTPILSFAFRRPHGAVARAGVAAALLVLMFTVWVGMMRKATPFQFTWVLAPWYAAALALGVYWASGRYMRGVATGSAVLALALHAVAACFLATAVMSGEGYLTSRVMDIKGNLPSTVYRDPWFPAAGHQRLGQVLCESPPSTALHGELAYIADKDVGLDQLFACKSRGPLWLGTSDAPAHLAGMAREFWNAAGRSAPCRAGSLGISTGAVPLMAQPGLRMSEGETYLPRKPSGLPLTRRKLDFETRGSDIVLVTNVIGGYEGFEVRSAIADGMAVTPRARNDVSALFVPPGAQGAHRWSIEVDASDWRSIDVVSIANERPREGCDTSTPTGSAGR